MLQVAVIGGGLVGACAAYRLVQRGASVTLVDAALRGQASAAGAGMLPALDHFTAAPHMLPLLKTSRAHYRDLVASLSDDGELETGYRVVGALQVAMTEAELASLPAMLKRGLELWRSGFSHVGQMQRLTPNEVWQLHPLLSPAVVGALYAPEAARVDARLLRSAALRAFERRGGRRLRGMAELSLETAGVSVRVGSTLLRPDAVIISAGAWAGALAERIGLRLRLGPQRGQILHFGLPGLDASAWPIALRSPTNYLLSFPGDRIVVGATREAGVGFDVSPTQDGQQAIRAQGFELAPALARAAELEVRVGFRPVTDDDLPVLGATVARSDVHFATGHGGYGIEVGPCSAALVADQLMGYSSPVELSRFSPDRFG